MGPLYCWKKTLSSLANHRSCPQKPVCCTRLDSLAIHIQHKMNPGPDFSANHLNYFAAENIKQNQQIKEAWFPAIDVLLLELAWDSNTWSETV